LRRAVALLLAGDGEVYGIAVLTLKIGLISTVLACGLGIPVGFVLATRPFWGRRAALTVVNTALAFPTVVVGLLLYGLLSRRGPLGGLEWLYTWQAIVVGDVVLALPIAAALAAAAVQGVDPRIRRTAETLGAGRWRTAWTVAREARFALAAVITTAFGHVVAEIGSAMTVGGNIRGQTRTLTTAVVRVRVWPRMLPPTVMADPISATTWPKAVVITAARANRASRATVHAVRHRPAPSVSAVRRMRGSTPWTAAAASAAAMGRASTTSPTTIACQV